MANLLLLSCLVVATAVSAAVTTPAPPVYPRGWVNLFEPPFESCPTIMLGIACVAKDLCYIPGGANGVGFDVLQFNGEYNGNFTGMLMPKPPMLLMAMAAGGTKAVPHGLVAGVGVGNGVQYLVNSTTWLPSQGADVFLMESQDVRATRDGVHQLIVDSGNNAVLYSHNAGLTFAQSMITTEMPYPNLTEARYAAMPTDKVWYVTLGSWPNNNNNNNNNERRSRFAKDSIRLSEVRELRREDGVWRRRVVRRSRSLGSASSGSASADYGYSAVIAKTEDGGMTWHNVMYEANNWYPNGIDCSSPTHCIAVGEGDNLPGGGFIYLTTDGRNFHKVFELVSNATNMYSLMSVAFNGPNEAWAAGGMDTQSGGESVFLYTKDGGHTWTQHSKIDYVMDVAAMSFVDGVGYAVALTSFDDSTVLRYDTTGPNPTPAPTWNGPFSQVSCSDNNCQVNCTTMSFPQNVCLPLGGNQSAIAQCQPEVLMQAVFPLSPVCSFLSGQEVIPLNQCLQNQGGGSFVTYCGPVPTTQPPVREMSRYMARKQPGTA